MYEVKKNCGNPACVLNGQLHGHWTEEDPAQPPAETGTSTNPATEKPAPTASDPHETN